MVHITIGLIAIFLFTSQVAAALPAKNEKIFLDERRGDRALEYFSLDMSIALSIWEYRDLMEEQNRTRKELEKCERDYNVARAMAARGEVRLSNPRHRKMHRREIRARTRYELDLIDCVVNRTQRDGFYNYLHQFMRTMDSSLNKVEDEVIVMRPQIGAERKARLVERMKEFRLIMLSEPNYREQLLDVADLAKSKWQNETVKFPPEPLAHVLHRITKHGLIRRTTLAVQEMLEAIDYVVPCWPDDLECRTERNRKQRCF